MALDRFDVEKVLFDVEKISFLLDTAVSHHLDVCGQELEMIIDMVRELNTGVKNNLGDIVDGE